MISVNDIKKLAALARVKIAPEEEETLTKEVDAILEYVNQIKEVSATLDEARHVPEHHNVFREDATPHESGIHTEHILSNSPDRDGHYVKVKKILS